jgi:hypothetical protein
MMNCGKTATIIACRSYRDIDVKFENGIIVKNRRYSDFQNGMIAYPGYFRELYLTDKTGESKVVNCGLKATIITYVNCLINSYYKLTPKSRFIAQKSQTVKIVNYFIADK